MNYLCFRYFIFIYVEIVLAHVEYHWPESDNSFDFIVGIAINKKPVGIGTLIKEDLIVTSANSLETYYKKTTTENTYTVDMKAEIHAIHQFPNTSRTLTVNEITVNYAKRSKVWIRMGNEKTHSPIHDLIFISIKEGQVKNISEIVKTEREAYYLPNEFLPQFATGWTFAGFGYLDRYHVKTNSYLYITTYEDSDVADCDEWLPRPWGRFVCLLNVEDIVGVQSGSPLFYNGTLRGIGCFSLNKGKESILVFTDLKEYEYIYEDDI